MQKHVMIKVQYWYLRFLESPLQFPPAKHFP
jgi:hypothetical protein